jgi:hypothetical protein
MGISNTITGLPVRAHKVDVSAESMPPLMPTTKPCVLLLAE